MPAYSPHPYTHCFPLTRKVTSVWAWVSKSFRRPTPGTPTWWMSSFTVSAIVIYKMRSTCIHAPSHPYIISCRHKVTLAAHACRGLIIKIPENYTRYNTPLLARYTRSRSTQFVKGSEFGPLVQVGIVGLSNSQETQLISKAPCGGYRIGLYTYAPNSDGRTERGRERRC